MKKIILLLIVVALAFTACSKSGDEPTATSLTSNPNGTLPMKIITTNGTNVVTQDFSYIGNKLARSQFSNVDYNSYTYTNDLITGIAVYRSNALDGTVTYTYNGNNKLVQTLYLKPSLNQAYKDVYTYNTDGTVSLSKYSGNLTTQNTNTENYKVFFQNGLATKREEYKLINGIMETEITNYTYDAKNYIFNSVLGYNKLPEYSTSKFGCLNNIISATYSATNTAATSTSLSTYTYNDSNYPIKKTETNLSGSLVVQIFYQ
ncbi:MAG: hypothetical protein ABI549_09335 [Flavobacterium sp.]|uniref:hypothetical protein n=1 Tax=Flavobacterium sp. TaxID=239 RepID=UPI003266DA74